MWAQCCAGCASGSRAPDPTTARSTCAVPGDSEEPVGVKRILGRVDHFKHLEPALLGRVEQLIDFVTA